MTVNGDTVCPSGSGLQRFAEGFFIEDVAAPASFCSPTSGLFTEKRTCDGVCEDGDTFYAVNRDANLSISNGMYAQFAKHGTEWRPIWVSCSATNPATTTAAPTTTTTVAPTTTTTTAAASTQSCTYQYNGSSWSYFSGGSCGSCDCSTNFDDVTLTNLYSANAGSSPLGGATITTSQNCSTCGHTYVSHT